MLLAGGVVGVAAAGVYAHKGWGGPNVSAATEEEGEMVNIDDAGPDQPASSRSTWRESAGRTTGRDGYVFGDLTRGGIRNFYGTKTAAEVEEDKAIEAASDEQYTQVQKLVREAVKVFRARGYNGSINMSHTVAYFNESCSVKVDASEDAPWLTGCDEGSATSMDAVTEQGKAGRVFTTLLTRLERRALAWESMSGNEGLDPSLTSAAQIGFAIPVVKLGWGVSVSLTVTTSSLLRWSAHYASLQRREEEEAQTASIASAVSLASVNKALKIVESETRAS